MCPANEMAEATLLKVVNFRPGTPLERLIRGIAYPGISYHKIKPRPSIPNNLLEQNEQNVKWVGQLYNND